LSGRDGDSSPPLLEEDVDPDPLVQFKKWFSEARASGIAQPDAMTLATAVDEHPSARVVLLKHFDESGFVFFSNYQSQKGREIADNPNVALCFVWLELHRQVRIVGIADRVTSDESDAYFASRPRGAQIAASASPQSEILASRAELESNFARIEQEAGDPALRPSHWGGFRVVPATIEFWQGQPDRLHDRLRYRREAGNWIIERLAP
jgi:pyridoxamine 5'-phosphate oxidase